MQKLFYSIEKIVLSFILLLAFSICQGQSDPNEIRIDLVETYNSSLEKYGIDQQLANGVLFEDINRNAIGHPYFVADSFLTGSLIYRNKTYKDVIIKYDINLQQLLINHQHPDYPLITLLTDEFLSAFSLYGLKFKKLTFKGREPNLYQVISDKGEIQCYYYWYKNRKESIKDNSILIYNYSKDKRKTFLSINGELFKYSGNRSFNNYFPDDIKGQIRNYQKSNDIKVRKASDEQIREVIVFCQDLLNQRKM